MYDIVCQHTISLISYVNIWYRMLTYDIVCDVHIQYCKLRAYDIACIFGRTIPYTICFYGVTRITRCRTSDLLYCMFKLPVSYDIVWTYDIVHPISYVQSSYKVYTISYISRYSILHPTLDVLYRTWYRRWRMISYVARIQMCDQLPSCLFFLFMTM